MDARVTTVQQWRAGKGRGRRRLVPVGVRSAAVAVSVDRRADGATWEEIARELGFGVTTLQRWASSPTGSAGRAVTVSAVPVVVDDDGPRSEAAPLVLVSPRGYRLEGLRLEDAARVLQVLG